MSKIDYRASGVDIDEGNRFVSLIKKMVESTHNDKVLGGLGGFAGFFSLDEAKNMEKPTLVSGTDGVGTKLKVAIDTGRLDTVGIDLVAMCVNDIAVTGAKPLFFLDYLATGKLSGDKMADVVKGIVEGCRQADSALIGGETAEMPGMYAEGDFDLAGFSVGILDLARAVDGKDIKAGDVITAIPSSGLHSNGYSLARKMFFENFKLSHDDVIADGKTVADLLLEPTVIYVPHVKELMASDAEIKGMVHITGGGFYENIPRILPENTACDIDVSNLELPAVYKYILDNADVDMHELYRVFNMGAGFLVITGEADAQAAQEAVLKAGSEPVCIGRITEGSGGVRIKGIDFE